MGRQLLQGYLKNHLWGFDLMVLLGKYLSRETFRSFWGIAEKRCYQHLKEFIPEHVLQIAIQVYQEI